MTFANLHLHTFFSDGALSPAEVFDQLLADGRISHFSLNDHDSLGGIEPMFRAIEAARAQGQTVPHFIPGVELSLEEKTTGLYIHMLGYFPNVRLDNYRAELSVIDSALGDYCRKQCAMRGRLDIDNRIDFIWRENLDNVRSAYASPEPILSLMYSRERTRIEQQTSLAGKAGDVINHPIPMTYQCLTTGWPEVLPDSLSEIMMLYIVRQERSKIERLAQLLESVGRTKTDARAMAEKYQGALSLDKYPGAEYASIFEGLALIQAAGGIAVLAHPAVARKQYSFDDYDALVTVPLINAGLDGIEVFYPYNAAFRTDAIAHYDALADRHQLLKTGGTDFHGDGRSRLDDVQTPSNAAMRLIARV
ncbi:MAG: hypothetical protein ABIH86_07000 [Planctomycetota bacterium]